MRVRSIFHQRHAMLLTDGFDFIQVRRNDAAHMYEDHGLGIGPELAAQILGIHLKVFPLAVDEDHLGASTYRRSSSGDKCMAWDDDGATLDRKGAQDHLQGASAVCCSHSVFHPT